MAKEYSATGMSFVFGPVIGRGLAEGDFLELVQNAEQWGLKIGADGEGCRFPTNNKSARITLTLMQSSSVNDQLTALINADVNLQNGSGKLPLLVRDRNGRSLYTAEQAWIVKHPDAKFGQEPGPRVWIFETDNLIRFDGGNN